MAKHPSGSVKGTTRPMNQVIKKAMSNGWRAQRTRGGHIRFDKKGCGPVFTAFTPSDNRSLRNLVAQLRRSERAGKAL